MAELSNLLLLKANDPRLKNLTLTEVKMSPDLKRANVYFGFFNRDLNSEEAEKALKGSAGFFRKQIGDSLELKYVPEIIFHPDRSLEHSQRMEEIFKQIARDDEP